MTTMTTLFTSACLACLATALTVATTGAADAAPVDEAVEATYTQVIDKRADGVVKALDVQDAATAARAKSALLAQYRALRAIHDARDARIAGLKSANAGDKATLDAAVAAERESAQQRLDALNVALVTEVSTFLSPAQVESLKNALTYNVLPITMRGYEEMLPTLTSDQRAHILTLLTEAREKAMTGGSSEEKHAWFGKYKGRINNYLSAQGYDLKQANKDWAARRKAAQQPSTTVTPGAQPAR